MISIDRNTIYKTPRYSFKNFVQLSFEEKLNVLNWRNDINVRQWMYHSEVLQLDDHLKFVDGLSMRDDCYYWLVYDENEPIGVMNVTGVDKESDKAELGYYLVPGLCGEGFFFVRECFFFFFEILKIKTFYGAVNEDNSEAIMLDRFFGCEFLSFKTLRQNEKDIRYWVCDDYSPMDFLEKYKLDVIDYIKYVKDENRKIRSRLCKSI